MPFPQERPRRMRSTEALRRLVRETTLAPDDLIWPLFVVPGKKVRNAVKSMPGVFQLSVDELVAEAQAGYEAGVRSVILFGIPEKKDAIGSSAWDEAEVVPRAIRALKEQVPGMVVMTDVCMCEYTDHGHCGVLKPSKAGGPGQDLVVDHTARGRRHPQGPQGLPDGPRELARGAPRGRARRPRGRGHGHGEAGRAVPRHRPPAPRGPRPRRAPGPAGDPGPRRLQGGRGLARRRGDAGARAERLDARGLG